MSEIDPQAFFNWKPIRAARVSEISEVTAAAPVESHERVNFHIGNPLQDGRHASAILRVALGLDAGQDNLDAANPAALLEALGWGPEDKPKLDFIARLIQKSAPYMPRGGYSRKDPNRLAKAFSAWLGSQQEPLNYDFGELSARREMILASGGLHEILRVVLFVISSHLETTPARILCYRSELLPRVKALPNLLFEELSNDEDAALEQIEALLEERPETPTFLLLGGLLSEATRRKLRLLSIERPLFFIEVNNAPNHLSLAREAKLSQRVVRLLTAAIFAPRLDGLSTVFIAGNADFLSVIENVHFQLKGTPSASEIELLIYLLEHNLAPLEDEVRSQMPKPKALIDGGAFGIGAETSLPQIAARIEAHLERVLEARTHTLGRYLARMDEKAAGLSGQLPRPVKSGLHDEFSDVEARELLDLLVQNLDNPDWRQRLERSFLGNFLKHQPHYRREDCLVSSGSSRTVLGIMGFHCGISEVVIPDLSWSYEQCFPRVHVVPLTASLELDVDAVIGKVEELIRLDASWQGRGAVVISNPHNATGRVFDEGAIRKLVKYCLQRNINLLDDLAYQNLAPVDDLPEIKTARQIVAELVRQSVLDEIQAARLTTVHSVSKTDSMAGARLAVVEIRDPQLRRRFEELNAQIQPNLAAIYLSYLFYRASRQAARTCWRLRNQILYQRAQALEKAVRNLPADRNPYGLSILAPQGSLYPLLQIAHLPAGLSLDWLASSLARRGVGMLPLSTFARTEKGFDTGRTTFRLTLGGRDGAEALLPKTRRLLIDLNRLIAEEEARYNRARLSPHPRPGKSNRTSALAGAWRSISDQILQKYENNAALRRLPDLPSLDREALASDFRQRYLPERLDVFRTRLLDRAQISDELVVRAQDDGGDWLGRRIEREFMKDSLARRREMFRLRSYDRTVHPTQMFSLQAELSLDALISALINRRPIPSGLIEKAAGQLLAEYLGQNVKINSQDEADEILLDLASLTAAEQYGQLYSDQSLHTFLSFWSDWDGSNRPSGQGHRLIAAVVMENVRRMTRIIRLLQRADPLAPLDPGLLDELDLLPERNRRFTKILNSITGLTHQLEQRYRGILPFSVDGTPLGRLAARWPLRRDPARVLWQHNDRFERKMLELRQQRRNTLEYYFELNKKLRKQLYACIPTIQENRASQDLLREVVGYSDILQRIIITPRIHQGLITALDQFAIDTTIFNMNEINAIAGKYGNPGMTLALQVSFSTKPEALISLDRKMRIQEEQMKREYAQVEIPMIWLVPLFEDRATVGELGPYLDRVLEYATQSRHTAQSPQERFAEIISEVFIAGSDLSQQAGQAAGDYLYSQAKYEIQSWLAGHGLAEAVRIKLGSGEPMQRQGAYYSKVAGRPAIIDSEANRRRVAAHLPPAARRSTAYAVTPLQGVFLGGDLRTFQSNLSEQLRFLPLRDFAGLQHHVRQSQMNHRDDLIRAAETLTESRMGAQSWSVQELKRLTIGAKEAIYGQFLEELTENFRHILYGQEEDVVGIHAISYFIGRSLPQLRDRPTSRRRPGAGGGQQILADIAKIIPLAKQGSLLRAIAHNQSQTVVLGVNQLTTGLFRALERFAQKNFAGAEKKRKIAERLLPHLPVYEILSTLRLYQDWDGTFLKRVETAFPAANSAFVALREDRDAMRRYLPLFQQELLRRHGLNVNDFFTDGFFIPDLLPTLRPDLAVLLQRDLSNRAIDGMLADVSGGVAAGWRAQVENLLQLPQQVSYWRAIIWEIMGQSIYQRVQSFAELAAALYSFSSVRSFEASPKNVRATKLPPALEGFLRSARPDDEMRHFLIGTLEYLNSFAEENIEVPISIIRAMNDVERIGQIEESALPPAQQEVIRFCLLQIARLAGENG